MNALTRTQNSVAFHLLKAVFVLYFLFTFALTVSHMLLEYRNTKSAVARELTLVQQSFSQGLSTALFELNEEQLHAIVQGMVTLPAVTGVKIETVGAGVEMTDAFGTVTDTAGKPVTITESGTQASRDVLFWQDFTIYFQDSEHVLGKGRIYSSNAVVYEQVKDIFVIIIGGAVLKTAALWFLFLWAARSRLNRPITVLTTVMDAINFDTDERLDIDIRPSAKKGKTEIRFDLAGRLREQVEVHTNDEIHRLTTSFKSLSASTQRKLQGLILLSHTAANLIKLTQPEAIFTEIARTLSHRYAVTTWLAVLCDDAQTPVHAWRWLAPAGGVHKVPLPSAAALLQQLLSTSRPHTVPASAYTDLLAVDDRGAEIDRLVVVPLIESDHRLGFLLFAGQGTAVDLAQEDEVFLGALSRLTVIALKNVHMLTVIQEQSRTLEHQVNTRTEQLQRAVRELESFNYAVSHDLRAPLRHVNSFLLMLIEDLPDPDRQKIQPLIGRMQAALQRMRDMIEGMLTLAGAGHAAPRMEPVSLAALVADVVHDLPDEVRTRTQFDIGALGSVQADRSLLRQVLQNLIDNAVKYAGKNATPCVWIQQLASAGNQHLTVQIRDNGVGFEQQYSDKLFKLFQRLHRAEDFPGTGVGLAVCAKIIQLHGGRIWAEGAPNQGASFYFTMPASQPTTT